MAEESKPIKTERIDNPDGTYTVKEFYEKSLTLAVYDNNDRLLSNKWFHDYECKEFIGEFWRKYNKDNSYIEYINYYDDKIDYYNYKQGYKNLNLKLFQSEIRQVNNANKRIASKTYSAKNFKKLICSTKFEYDTDENITRFTIYEKPQENLKYLSTIDYLNKNITDIKSNLYSDKNYKNLVASEKRKFNEAHTQYQSDIVYEKPYNDIYFYDNYYSSRTIANINGKKQIYYYKDKNYSILAKEYNYNEDGSYIINKIYDKPNGENCYHYHISVFGYNIHWQTNCYKYKALCDNHCNN